MLALALALKEAGHRVRLIASPENRPWAEKEGCEFMPLGWDVLSFIRQQPDAHTLRGAFHFNTLVRQGVKQQLEGLEKIIQGADIVLGASLMFGLSSVAEYCQIPYRYIVFCPQLLPSARHPFPALKHQGRPRWFNRLSWWLPKVFDLSNVNLMINRYRRRVGLDLLTDAWRHILGDPVLVASDPSLAGVPDDVVQDTHQSGYLHLPVTGELDSSLLEFIHDGSPPIFIGFGSMPEKDQRANRALVQEAIGMAGVRAVISGGFGDTAMAHASGTCFWVADCPHALLFPHMAAVIHHGGAGTTAASALAGVPQVIVPHVLDQYYWAQRIFSLSLGPEPIWRGCLTAKSLASAIQQCINTEQFAKNAQKIAEDIRQQTPLTDAVQYITSKKLIDTQNSIRYA